MKHHLLQTSFLTGAIDADGRARSDTALYKNGAARLLNCLPRASGGQLSRPGFAHRWFIGADQPVVIREFSFSLEQSYILVFLHTEMRAFYATDGGLAGALSSCPWASTQLAEMRFAQSGDTLIVTHPAFAAQRILRMSTNTWSIAPLTFDGARGVPMFRYVGSGVVGQSYAASATKLTLAGTPTFGAGEATSADIDPQNWHGIDWVGGGA